MDNDDDFRFSLLQGRILTEIRNSDPGLARRILELELDRSLIIDLSLNDHSAVTKSNIYDTSFIERKPNYKQIEENFKSLLDLPLYSEASDRLRNLNSEKIDLWNMNKKRIKSSNDESSVDIPKSKTNKNEQTNNRNVKRSSSPDDDGCDSLLNRIVSETNHIKKMKINEEPINPRKAFGSALDLFVENQVMKKKISSTCAEEILENKAYLMNKEKDKKKNNPSSSEEEGLGQFDPKIIEQIKASIPDKLDDIGWDTIAGLEEAKKKIQQVAILPLMRPEFFTGIRKPPKGILLFGPPGTGKTMIGKCIAAQAKARFFSITAASITSKWMGESEKTMKALFTVARMMKPSVIFVDEIDSLLTTRSSGENDCTIRVKTEFLSQFNGLESDDGDQLLVIGTTNRPEELDRAVLRRFSVRLLISLPNANGRKQMLLRHMKDIKNTLTDEEVDDIIEKTDGYVGSDMFHLAQAAAMMPIDHMNQDEFLQMKVDDIRPVSHDDFLKALSQVPASFDKNQLAPYLEWNRQYGTNFS